MGIIVNKETERRTELTDRVSSNLRERTRQTGREAETDFVDDSEYAKDLKKGSRFSWFWFVLILLAVVSILYICVGI